MIDVDQYDEEFGGPPRPRPRWIWWLVFALLAILVALPLAGCGNRSDLTCGIEAIFGNRDCSRDVPTLRYSLPMDTRVDPVMPRAKVSAPFRHKSLQFLVDRDRQNPFDIY